MHSEYAYGIDFPDCKHGVLTENQVCNAHASPQNRATARLAAMNITEKLNDLTEESAGSRRLGLAPYNWWNEALHSACFSDGVNFGVDF